jgi:hypothetical protein
MNFSSERACHYYHMMLDAVARVSIISKSEMEEIRNRLLSEASRSNDDADKQATQLAAQICEVYINVCD